MTQRPRLSTPKLLLFSALPAVVLLAAIEVSFRALELAEPRFKSIPLPEEQFGILVQDPDLFWRLRPNVTLDYGGEPAGCRTNALGLRSGPIDAKRPGEFRILALGESTTFGVGVPDRMAYPQRLESLLREGGASPACRVINAGVSAWSSFQSRRFLETRGLALQPDLVLVYHEINDYMPASFRSGGHSEAAMLHSDPQLHDALQQSFGRRILSASAFVRWATYYQARRTLAKLRGQPRFVEPEAIGLPQIGLRPLVVHAADEHRTRVNEKALPTRVPPAERRRMLEEMRALCRSRGIALVVIHPSYRASEPHTCVLTEFCQVTGVPMLDAQPVLHPHGVTLDAMFLDKMHPTARGHAALAEELRVFLVSRRLVPTGEVK